MLRSIGELSAVAILAFIAVAGFLVGFPSRVGMPGYDITIPLLLAVFLIVGGITCVAGYRDRNGRRRMLRLVSVLAGISIVASFLLHLFQRGVIEVSPAHLLGPMLKLDGQYAFEAAEFEVYCELWLCAAAIMCAAVVLVWGSRRVFMKRVM
ncbi:MAG: hypothetical protein P4L57_15525 [Rhizomicrobium sp.]|nr:hypothetical protein [Rhizomicrobium sp.]